jgi:hypothetical protein
MLRPIINPIADVVGEPDTVLTIGPRFRTDTLSSRYGPTKTRNSEDTPQRGRG